MSLIVIEMQQKLGLTADGIAGEKTKTAMNEALKQGKITQEECDAFNRADPNDDKITKNIRLSELTLSPTAQRLGIDNTPNENIKQNLIESCTNLWQPTRDLLGVAMSISSGYRSPALNKAVGGSPTSAHCYGRAIDFTAPKFGSPRKIVEFLAKELPKHGVKFDQIILEFDRWIHLGYKSPNGEQRGQVLTAKKVNGKTKYFVGAV